MRNLTGICGTALSRLATLGCVLLLVALAGCGLSSTSGVGADQPPMATASATSTATVTVPATVTAPTTASTTTGCPGPAQSVEWPAPPAAIVTHAQSTTAVKVGQALEVRLPFGHHWSMAASALNGTFTLDAPAGYADAQSQTCIWHFTAKRAGTQDLSYAMAPICAPHTKCPQTIIIAFDITLDATA
jgi:hypothetical protein